MAESREWTYAGHAGKLAARTWSRPHPRYISLVPDGYGEHIGRSEHVGHGRSARGRVLVTDYEQVVADFHALAQRAHDRDPGLPTVLVGHSMGGMIVARYAQLHGAEPAALALRGGIAA